MSRMKLLADVVQDMRNLADSLQTLVDALAEPERFETSNTSAAPAAPTVVTPEPPAPNPAEKKDEVTKAQVRTVLTEKNLKGLTKEVRALLKKYGANKLSEVSPADYPALLADGLALPDPQKEETDAS